MEVSMALAQPTPIFSTTSGAIFRIPLEILSVPEPAGSFAVVRINIIGQLGANEEVNFFMDNGAFARLMSDATGKLPITEIRHNLDNIVVPGGSKITVRRSLNNNATISFLVSGLFYKAS
jgi:hypothetical protein